MRKNLAVLAAAVLCFGLLSGCKNQNQAATAPTTRPTSATAATTTPTGTPMPSTTATESTSADMTEDAAGEMPGDGGMNSETGSVGSNGGGTGAGNP